MRVLKDKDFTAIVGDFAEVYNVLFPNQQHDQHVRCWRAVKDVEERSRALLEWRAKHG